MSFDNGKQLAFRRTPFGPWLDLAMSGHDPMLVNMFLQMEVSATNAEPDELYFDVYGHALCFGRREFCLITGLRFGPPSSLPSLPTESFVSRVFPDEDPKSLKTSTVYERMMLNYISDLPQDDAIRVCLVVMVELVFMGRELRQFVNQKVLRAVEDLRVFCNYPWGEYIWGHTFKQMHKAYSRRAKKNELSAWTMSGFTYAFKVRPVVEINFLITFAFLI